MSEGYQVEWSVFHNKLTHNFASLITTRANKPEYLPTVWIL